MCWNFLELHSSLKSLERKVNIAINNNNYNDIFFSLITKYNYLLKNNPSLRYNYKKPIFANKMPYATHTPSSNKIGKGIKKSNTKALSDIFYLYCWQLIKFKRRKCRITNATLMFLWTYVKVIGKGETKFPTSSPSSSIIIKVFSWIIRSVCRENTKKAEKKREFSLVSVVSLIIFPKIFESLWDAITLELILGNKRVRGSMCFQCISA